MLMDMSLSKFNIYQNAATPICFRATQTLDVLIFFTLSRVTFFLPDNVSVIPKFIFRSGFGKHWASGTVKENKYHTVYTATIVERERVFFVCCIMIN